MNLGCSSQSLRRSSKSEDYRCPLFAHRHVSPNHVLLSDQIKYIQSGHEVHILWWSWCVVGLISSRGSLPNFLLRTARSLLSSPVCAHPTAGMSWIRFACRAPEGIVGSDQTHEDYISLCSCGCYAQTVILLSDTVYLIFLF